MPITLSLTGHADLTPHRLTRSEARDWLDKAAVWFEGSGDAVLDARVVRDHEDKPLLFVSLHPASPPAEVRLGASGRVRVSATTSPAGPGYHIHLCELFRLFAADFDLTWDEAQTSDPTGFFDSSDLLACERHFLHWLAEECAGRSTPGAIGLPAHHGLTYPGEVLTPLGPRTHAWRNGVADDPSRGRDYFAWWSPELDAAFYRGRALTRLWCDFPWRLPLNEAEGEQADQIANDLAAAFKLDPTAELPWNEWLEVLGAIEQDQEGFTVTPKDPVLTLGVVETNVEGRHDFPQGRRVAARVPPLPDARAADGGVVRAGARRLRSGVGRRADLDRVEPDSDVVVPRPRVHQARRRETERGGALDVGCRSLPEGEPIRGLDHEGVHGAAVFGPADEDGRTVWRLSGVAAVPGQLAVCNVYSEAAGDRDWAEVTWQSLRHTAPA